ncbi:hypothetical protein BHM03_00023806 [Ensete ventricosum]|nr:hypothetical protein BHM03_00023806 [Ensete ventricosum]
MQDESVHQNEESMERHNHTLSSTIGHVLDLCPRKALCFLSMFYLLRRLPSCGLDTSPVPPNLLRTYPFHVEEKVSMLYDTEFRSPWDGHEHSIGSAKSLIKAALHEAARKREMRYSDLKRIDKKVRRHFQDDITVIIIFLNHEKVEDHMKVPQLSVRSALDH